MTRNRALYRRFPALLLIVASIAAIAALGVPMSAAARSVNCRPPAEGQGPRNDSSLPIGLLRAHDMSCQAARRAIRHGSFTTKGNCFGGPGGPPCQTFFRTPGFRCRAIELGAFRCRAHRRRFTFGWGE